MVKNQQRHTPACSQPTFKSASKASAAPSTTSSANAYRAASYPRTYLSFSMTWRAICKPTCPPTSTSTAMKRPHPPKCTLSFPFRGPNIGTHHSLPVSSAEMWYTEHMVFRTVWVMGAHFDGRQSKTNEEPPSPAPNGPALLTYPNQTELENIISPCRSLSSSPLDPFYLFP